MSIGLNAIYNPLLFVCICILILVLFYSGETYYNMLVTSLPLLLFSILLISVQILSVSSNTNINNTNDFNSIKNIFMSISPLIIISNSISIFLYLIVKYKNLVIGNCNKTNKNIFNTNKNYVNECVSSEYSKFSIISILLLILQVILIYKTISKNEFGNTGKIDTKMYAVLFLMGIVNLLLMFPLYTILTYFTADG